MVRLKSDKWYSTAGQRRSKTQVAARASDTRRLLSLCFLLGLVILLMQKAADPRHVRNAFNALGVPLDPTPATNWGEEVEAENSSPSLAPDPPQPTQRLQSSEESRWATACRDLIPRLLNSASNQQIANLAQRWFSTAALTANEDGLNRMFTDLKNNGLKSLQELMEQLPGAQSATTEHAQWLTELQRFAVEWQNLWDALAVGISPSTQLDSGRDPDQAKLSGEMQASMSEYIDRRLVDSLRQAAPWSQSETTAFWRLLQKTQVRAGQGAPEKPSTPLLNTLQLASDAPAYRGRALRFRGTLRRVQWVERSQPEMGIPTGYWLMWLRGEDEAVQPVAVYTLDPIAGSFNGHISDRFMDYPSVEVRGLFGKRLAYASAAGVQVAPTLFASEIVILPAERADGTPPPSLKSMWPELRSALIAGGLLAAAILLPLVFQKHGRLRRRSPSKMCMAFLIAAVCTDNVGGQDSTQALPPWADTSQPVNSLTALLKERLVQAFETTVPATIFRALADQDAPFPDELLRLIDRLTQFGWTPAYGIDQPLLLTEGLSLRAETISGWVHSAVPVPLSAMQRAWFATDGGQQLYRLEIQPQPEIFEANFASLSSSTSTLPSAQPNQASSARSLTTVYCRQVPEQWLESPGLRQPTIFRAIALYDQNEPAIEDGQQPVCLLARQPSWQLPWGVEAAELKPTLRPHLWNLGKRGWDLANIDIVAQRNQQPLSESEANAFYSLLRVTQSELPSNLALAAPTPTPLEILASPQQNIGQPFRWRIRIVSGTLVPVTSPQSQQQLGGKHYIQLDGFIDIGEERIRYQTAPTEQTRTTASAPPPLEFAGEFPVTIVTTQADSFIPQERLQAGETSWQIGRYAEVEGIFYRLWSYQSELVQRHSPEARQIAPLVVATKIVPTMPPIRQPGTATVGWFGYALAVATVVFLSAILFLASQKDRRPRI